MHRATKERAHREGADARMARVVDAHRRYTAAAALTRMAFF
jgi:hypothetical protein